MTFVPHKPSQVGTIAEVLKADVVERIANDGDHYYTHLQQDCLNQMPVVNDFTTIKLPLTNPNVHIVQFDKSFIQLDVEVKFQLTGFEAPDANDTSTITESLITFIGLKNASDCISDYALYHKGIQIMANAEGNGSLESFIYNSLRGEEEIKYRAGVHSVAEEVNKMNYRSHCGAYMKLFDFQEAVQNNENINVQFTFLIPYTDIPVFQEFQSYPSALFGDLELRFKFTSRPFLTMICDPETTIRKQGTEGKIAVLTTADNPNHVFSTGIAREYVQCGDTFKAITHAKVEAGVMTYQTGNVSIKPVSFKIQACHAIVAGYRAKPDELEKMRNYYEVHPWVKHCQQIGYYPYTNGPNASGFEMTQQVPLENTSSFVLRFPTTENEVGNTVSKNPMLTDLSLTVSGVRYPTTNIDTTSWSFLEFMRNSANAWNEKPTREFTESISSQRWDNSGLCNMNEDATSFICCIKVERPSAMGLVTDGLNSNGQSVPIRLSAKPKFNLRYDAYCGYATNPENGNPKANAVQPPPPELITVNDSYLVFNSKRGGQCKYSNAPFNEFVSSFMSA